MLNYIKKIFGLNRSKTDSCAMSINIDMDHNEDISIKITFDEDKLKAQSFGKVLFSLNSGLLTPTFLEVLLKAKINHNRYILEVLDTWENQIVLNEKSISSAPVDLPLIKPTQAFAKNLK